jgi:signal transduction histidine kinase
MIQRSSIVYGLLLAATIGIIGWQSVEHRRVKAAARAALVNRARDITTTLGVVIRSQRRFGSMVSQERIESALKDLVRTSELKSVSLLNAAGSVVASAGEPAAPAATPSITQGAHWDQRTVTLLNLVDLGTNVVQEGEGARPIIVLPRRDSAGGTNTERHGPPRSWRRSNPAAGTNSSSAAEPAENAGGTNVERGRRSSEDRDGPPPRGSVRENSGRAFGRPPWMSDAEYQALLEKQGLHSFVVVMSTDSLRAATTYDLWLRAMIGLLAAVAAAGLALAWRNVVKSSELQLRLVRASELNNHLREMNVAAAGLAHETRNPLNIIRGLAQMISKQIDLAPELRRKSRDITDEVDRVTAQLSEFINYSKPREVRRVPVPLNGVVSDVVRTLDGDLEEKTIRLTVLGEDVTVEADEQLLRQVLFNLVINAIQAVDSGGHIQVTSRRTNGSEAVLSICDNGPGVPVDMRKEIFKPYVTMHKDGTGLGLAVVQQIVLAHGWGIECLANQPRGAIFQISGLRVAQS